MTIEPDEENVLSLQQTPHIFFAFLLQITDVFSELNFPATSSKGTNGKSKRRKVSNLNCQQCDKVQELNATENIQCIKKSDSLNPNVLPESTSTYINYSCS
jgi:hypothetical protein